MLKKQKNQKRKNKMENEETETKVEKKKVEKLEKIQMDKLKGRVIIFNPEQSEFAKSLNLTKKADYIQKKQ